MPELLTPDEVAERLRVDREHVMRLARRKRIASVKVGRYRRFDPADVDAFETANKVAPADALTQSQASASRKRRT